MLKSRFSRYSDPFKKIKRSILGSSFTNIYSVVFNIFEYIIPTYEVVFTIVKKLGTTVVFNIYEIIQPTYEVIFNIYYNLLPTYEVIFSVTGHLLPSELKYEVIFSNIYENIDSNYTVIFSLTESSSTTSQDCIPFPCINQ